MKIVATVALVCCAYVLGTYSARIYRAAPTLFQQGTYDDLGRLVALPGKQRINCPTQREGVAILLAIGQSNAANHAETKFTTSHPDKVVNYHDGNCYIAASPLLGATGESGEFLTPLADRLIEDRLFESVVIVSSAIADTPISRWQRDGDLNEKLLNTVSELSARYRITHIIWHQGESDFKAFTSAKVYRASFLSLIDSLGEKGVTAPAFIAVATKCGSTPRWLPDNPTATGQRSLVDERQIFLGADTDALLARDDRASGECHFSRSGQEKTAAAYASAIARLEADPFEKHSE